MQPSTLTKRGWVILFVAIAGFYFWGLGRIPLIGPDEPRYAEVAREMFLRRDFITPTLGGLPWFEKPALLYWLMMSSYRVLGVSEYAARFASATCGLVTALFVYWIGRHVSGDAHESSDKAECGADNRALGRWAALVWLTMAGAIGFSRAASFDIVLTMTITGAMTCFVIQTRPRQTARQALVAVGFYFFTGLSLLAKGLVGPVIIFGVIAVYYTLRRELPPRRTFVSLCWGIPLTLALAGVWYGPMIARHGTPFIDQFIVQHHFARFASNKYHHPGPIYFYLPVLIGLALPWSIVMLAGFLSARRWEWRGTSGVDRARVLALAWLIFPIVFFSFSQSKLPAYILPALPAAALLVGERVTCFCRELRGEKVLRWTGALLIIVAAAGIWYMQRYFSASSASLLVAASPVAVVGAIAVVRPTLRRSLFVLIASASLSCAAISLQFVVRPMAREQSVRDLLVAATAAGYANTPLTQLHVIERTTEFYAANQISYEANGEPVKFEAAAQVLEAARHNRGAVLCLVPVKLAPQLTGLANADVQRVADNGRLVLFVVRAREVTAAPDRKNQ